MVGNEKGLDLGWILDGDDGDDDDDDDDDDDVEL